ncbi:MAG: Flp pilus assembly complex ATPase component TadA [Elusimicrobia bacterium]|nr:Flp pilus assembly complex ATPase component TadA [Elusimicrobiota bacterium]
MPGEHRFKDEWIVRAAAGIPGVGPEKIAEMRAKSRPSLAADLVADGALAWPVLGEALKAAHGFGWLGDEPVEADKLAVSLVPEKVCRRHGLAPLRLRGETLEIATSSPLDIDALSDVQAVSGRVPAPLYCLPERVVALIDEFYRPEALLGELVGRLDEHAKVEIIEGGRDAPRAAEGEEAVETPVVDLVNAVLSRAARMRASDIHIEHDEHSTHVRLRIDGLLRPVLTVPRAIGTGPIVSRIKIMAELDIAEHRRPQDGRAKIRVDGVELGLRVSVLPTNFGEKIVIRMLDPRAASVPFEQLGFSPEIAARLDACCLLSQGIVLVTGPTGAGKTTTLYSVLNRLKSPDSNLVTVEDPIEYKLEGINQVQVREKQGLTFASVLRSVLRQDPDIIMVGEIRDQETAVTAFQAALTGHLVLTTLHTNDTVAALTRLSDMGIERFKVGSGLLAITAQRLVRRACKDCRRPRPDGELDEGLRAAFKAQGLEPKQWSGAGCAKCEQTGYKGRLLIVEFLEIGDALRERIVAGDGESDLRRAALKAGALHTLRADALRRVQEGDTTYEEILPYISAAEQPGSPEPAAAPAEAAPPPVRSAARGASPRILLSDDDKAIRLILRKAFEAEGWAVEEAADGEQALSQAGENPPDVLVLDLDMPKLDGYGVIKGLRQGLGLVDLPILILTASSDDKSQEQALSLGADDFVTKPFRPSIVTARLKAILRRRTAAAR